MEGKPARCSCQRESRTRPFCGTLMTVTTLGQGEACARRAQALAFECVEALEARFAVTGGDSDMMRLLDAPIGRPVMVSDPVWQLLRIAHELASRTDGIFDAVAAGSDGTADWTDIDLTRYGHVTLERRLRIDLQGILHGFAADLAAQALCERGARRGIVDVGGVMRAFGPQEWRVQYHLAEGQVLPLALMNGALAGSGNHRGRLFDPVTRTVHSGQEWRDLRLVVRAPSAAMADGLTKVAMLAPARSASLLSRFGASATALAPGGVQALEYAS